MREKRNRQAADRGAFSIAFSATTALEHAPFHDKAVTRMFNTFATGLVLLLLKKKPSKLLHYLNAGTVISGAAHQAVQQSALCYVVAFRGSAYSVSHHRRGLETRSMFTFRKLREA